MLHELTHAWQFELHPWLREYLGKMIGELSRAPVGGKGLGLEELMQAARSIRPQLVLIGRVQAVMTTKTTSTAARGRGARQRYAPTNAATALPPRKRRNGSRSSVRRPRHLPR